MSEIFSAPCVGGPSAGQLLPYEFAADGGAFPMSYTVYKAAHSFIKLGEYRFIPGNAERFGTGDTWRWHEFIPVCEHNWTYTYMGRSCTKCGVFEDN